MFLRASIVTVLLLASSAFIARAAVPVDMTTAVELEQIPFKLQNWSGTKAAAWDEEIMRKLGVDQYLHRVYRHRESKEQVWLYVGFYGSQSQGDTIHSPLHCLPGSGWEPVEKSQTQLRVPRDGGSQLLAVNQLLVEKGTDRMSVIYWYQSQGRVASSEYWSRLFTVFDAVRRNRSDGAIVRVIAPASRVDGAAATLATDFASEVYPSLASVLPH